MASSKEKNQRGKLDERTKRYREMEKEEQKERRVDVWGLGPVAAGLITGL